MIELELNDQGGEEVLTVITLDTGKTMFKIGDGNDERIVIISAEDSDRLSLALNTMHTPIAGYLF